MKRFLLVGFIMISQFAMSQTPVPKIVKDHYTVSGGLLGALNFNSYRTVDNNILDYFFQSGWAAGGYLNFPLGNRVSFEPQVMYSKYSYKTTNAESLLKDGNVSFISIPLIFKWHVAEKFAFTVGPQFDLTSAVKDNNNVYTKDSVGSTQISVNAGVEFFPRARIVPFARYIHSFTDMNNTNSPTTANEWKNTNVQVGLKIKLFGKHILGDSDGDGIVDKDDKCPTQFGVARYQGCPIPDADADGINDEEDKCPSVPGLAKYQGCPIPDTDKDGINDEEDKCPQQPGLPKYQGCPIPDTDKDGVNDEEDKCPQVPGLAKYQGCPIPDTDGDGINDEEDKCPTIAGTAANGGCPVINFKAENIQFVSGGSTLTAGAKSELNKVIKILNEEYKDIKMTIAGHTDNTGKPEKNQELSIARAESVKKYLVSKGVNESRLTATGFGQDQPIADNTTKAGKAKNRRVEFKVSQ